MMYVGIMDIYYYGEMLWFVAVTVSVNCLVFVLCGAFEIIERFKIFESAKIQKKVSTLVCLNFCSKLCKLNG